MDAVTTHHTLTHREGGGGKGEGGEGGRRAGTEDAAKKGKEGKDRPFLRQTIHICIVRSVHADTLGPTKWSFCPLSKYPYSEVKCSFFEISEDLG